MEATDQPQMCLFLSSTLFPPPTKAWLQSVSSDPEAQGWGAWTPTEKTPLEPGGGGRVREGREVEEKEEEGGDEALLLSLLEPGSLAEGSPTNQRGPGSHPRLITGHQQELEAMKPKLWAMEEAMEPSSALGWARQEAGDTAGPLLNPKNMGCPFPAAPKEKVDADHRSVYVGNVDYGSTAEELEAHFQPCGEVHRVTILCDKFSGHPKGYAYMEFATKSSAQAALQLHESVFRGRVIKVLPKRTNFPGISSTDRGGLWGPQGRAVPFPILGSSLQGCPRVRPRGQSR
ncbi:embryonic polyadenylate-binding protein 2 [Ctenodactylus gundi]